MENREATVRKIISNVIKVKPDVINPDDDLVDKFSMDSMQRVEIVIELEKAFDVSISDDVAVTLRSVKKILDHLEKEVAPK